MNNFSNWLLAQSDLPMPDSAVHHEGTYWFPEQASTYANDVDFLYMAIVWVSTIFFVIIISVMILFVIKYRRRPGVGPQPSHSHNTALEIFWSVIPSIFLVWFFYVGARGYFDMKIPTDDCEEIHVTASQFNWKFVYPNGDISPELHLVLYRPTKLILRSEDVLHSLYVPAFRQKMDVVPGRYTYFYINPNRPGQYRLTCAEYCGEGHSRMRTLCQVHLTAEDREKTTQWLPEKHHGWVNGERLFKINCSGCHDVEGKVKTGPALNTIWKTDERLTTGGTVLVDENYIRESILVPAAKIVEGFGPVSKMNSFEGKLTDQEIHYLIEYIHYLQDPSAFPSRDEPVTAEKETDDASAQPAAGPATDETVDETKDEAEKDTPAQSADEGATEPDATAEDDDQDDDTTPPAEEPASADKGGDGATPSSTDGTNP